MVTLENYIKILKILDENIVDIDKNIKIYSILNNLSIKEVEKLDINLLNDYCNKLNNYFLNNKEYIFENNSFIFNDEKYYLDWNVFQTNVAHYRDREVILLNREGYDRIIPLLSLIVYKEGENPEYTSDRLNTNIGRVGGLPFNIGMSAIDFFTHRVQRLKNILQLYSAEQMEELMKMMEQIATENKVI